MSVTSLRNAQDIIIGHLLIGTNNTVREKADKDHLQLAASVFTHAGEGIMITDDTALSILIMLSHG